MTTDSITSPITARAALQDIAFGSAAGMVAELFEYPFDLAKVRLQAQLIPSASSVQFNGPWDCLRRTWAMEGIRGLYRGLPVPMLGSMGETASLFAAYTAFQNVLMLYNRSTQLVASPSELSMGQLAIAGGGAGFVTSFFLTPMELIKCQLQVQSVSTHQRLRALPGPMSILNTIVRTQGLQGLWLGQTGTLMRETAGSASWFVCKEATANYLVQRRLKTSPESDKVPLPRESGVSGAIAGAVGTLALYPADTVKSVIQTTPGGTSSFWTAAVDIYTKHGLRGLYAGCGMTVARAVPTSAIIFLVYDGLVHWVGG